MSLAKLKYLAGIIISIACLASGKDTAQQNTTETVLLICSPVSAQS